MLNLVLFGPPGAGKGTQAVKLLEKYQLIHLSTGDLLREQIAAGTELGIQAKSIIDKGDLVSDQIVIGMIDSKLKANQNARGFIFDGFPRTPAQAKALDELLELRGTAVSAMIFLEVGHDELVARLLNRGKISGRIDDQNISVIEKRVQVYAKETAPVKDHYLSQSKFVSVKGVGSVDEIFNALCHEIDKLL